MDARKMRLPVSGLSGGWKIPAHVQGVQSLRDSYGGGMGIVWEAYHKGVPLSGVPENPIDNMAYYNPLIPG